MKRLLAEWLWRAAIVCALGWIGWELHELRMDLQQPDDEATTAAAPEDIQDSIDVLMDDVATLNAKIDATMVAVLHVEVVSLPAWPAAYSSSPTRPSERL